jgi:TRAP-type C4-dicarboxylate transport system permease small subunit
MLFESILYRIVSFFQKGEALRLARWTGWVASDAPRGVLAILLLVAAGLNVANVIGRYAFGSPIEWADEAMVYAMVASIFIGTAPVAWDAAHLRMDLLLLATPPRVARALQGLSLAATLVACGFIFWQSVVVTRVIWRIGQTSPVMEMPMWLLHASVALGLGLTLVALITRARTHLQPPRPPGADETEAS